MKKLLPFLLLGILVSALISFTHYDFFLGSIRSHLGAEARSFTPQAFRRILILSRTLCPTLVVLGFFLLKKQSQIEAHLNHLGTELAVDWKALGLRWRRFIVREKSDVWVLLGLTLGGIVIRAFFFDTAVQVDEASSFVIYASKPFYNIMTQYMGPDQVFHSVIVHAMMRTFGTSLMSVRTPAFLAGILLIPAIYFLARALLKSRAPALVAASLVAVSPYLINYSVVSRGYTLLVLLSVVGFWFAVQIREQATKLSVLSFILVSAFGFWVIPTMAYPFAVAVFWLGSEWLLGDRTINRPRLLINIVIAAGGTVALTGIFYLPIILISGLDSLIHNPFVAPEPWPIFLKFVLPSLESAFYSWNWNHSRIFTGLLIVGCAVATFRHQAVSKFRTPLILIVIPLLAVLFIQRHVPYTRIWIFAIPLYLILASAGLCELFRICFGAKPKTAATLVSLVILGLGTSVALDHLQNQEELMSDFNAVQHGADTARWFQSRIRPGDVILLTWPDDVTLQYYFTQTGLDASQIRSNRGTPLAKTYLVLNRLRFSLEDSLQVSIDPQSKVQTISSLQKWKNTEIYELIF